VVAVSVAVAVAMAVGVVEVEVEDVASAAGSFDGSLGGSNPKVTTELGISKSVSSIDGAFSLAARRSCSGVAARVVSRN
jgi:hypothetical protein